MESQNRNPKWACCDILDIYYSCLCVCERPTFCGTSSPVGQKVEAGPPPSAAASRVNVQEPPAVCEQTAAAAAIVTFLDLDDHL